MEKDIRKERKITQKFKKDESLDDFSSSPSPKLSKYVSYIMKFRTPAIECIWIFIKDLEIL